ncbi:hypothetical protein QE152_g39214 [Popillia japonica]|uniref:Transmembrane protein n=1 Tax=Popillia japonica TaxID=7064 RepID=A0AAW1HV67_POPJA
MIASTFGASASKTDRSDCDTIAKKLSRNPSGFQWYKSGSKLSLADYVEVDSNTSFTLDEKLLIVMMAVNVIISCVLCWLLNEYTRKVVDCAAVLGHTEEEEDMEFDVWK